MKHRILLLVAAVMLVFGLGAISDTVAPTVNAAVPACGELKIIYSNGKAIGGRAWCAGHTAWEVVIGCSTTRYGVVSHTEYGPWMSRWGSVDYCPSKASFVRWVSYRTQG
jgi:hypothetical protein